MKVIATRLERVRIAEYDELAARQELLGLQLLGVRVQHAARETRDDRGVRQRRERRREQKRADDRHGQLGERAHHAQRRRTGGPQQPEGAETQREAAHSIQYQERHCIDIERSAHRTNTASVRCRL